MKIKVEEKLGRSGKPYSCVLVCFEEGDAHFQMKKDEDYVADYMPKNGEILKMLRKIFDVEDGATYLKENIFELVVSEFREDNGEVRV